MNEYVFNFGKHIGKKISEVPASYIQWIIENFDNVPKEVAKYYRKNYRMIQDEIIEDQAIVDELEGLHFGGWEYWKD